MNKQISGAILATLLIMTFNQCDNHTSNTVKLSPNDPFKNTIVPSQIFHIDSQQDNVVEGKNGTIIICPKGCFKNSKGEIVLEDTQIELSEALSLEDMLLSNLTTSSNGLPLETDGMIYFNATANGKQLTINQENPVHIEIPTFQRKAGMMAYKGVRDKNGDMNWIEPKKLDNFISTVDLNLLDFLPYGFRAEVEKGVASGKYKIKSPDLTDSLYYSLSASGENDLLSGLLSTKNNEEYYKSNEVVKSNDPLNSNIISDSDSYHTDTSISSCGINPAIIKILKSEKYRNTLIATREFEARLKIIHKTCNNIVLDLFRENLDKNLYELDSMAALEYKKENHLEDYMLFSDFSKLRLTKVKNGDKNLNLLKEYYENELVKLKLALEKAQEALIHELRKKNADVQKEVSNYKKILAKREKYRMETYGFTWTQTGWVNIDNGTLPKDWSKEPLEVVVKNGKQFDRVYVYVIYTSIKSLYRLNSNDKEQFYVGNNESREMLMPKKKLGVLVTVGYNDEIPSIAVREFETGSEPGINLTLSLSTIDKLKEMMRQYERYTKENEISKDLEIMLKFYKEEQRQEKLLEEDEFINRLRNIAYPCCSDSINGESLFHIRCSSCHNQGEQPLIGPGLAASTSKYSADWLYRWTVNSQALIESGDKQAIAVFEEFHRNKQPRFDLSVDEVAAIFKYIDGYNKTAAN